MGLSVCPGKGMARGCLNSRVGPPRRVPQYMLGYTPCVQNDMPVKVLPCHNYVADGKYIVLERIDISL